jgi:hypothetical protein
MSDPSYSPAPQPTADRSVKVPHLVFGLLFLGVAGIWALGASNAISGEHLAVLGPAVLIIAGVVGLAASLANGRNRRRSARAAYAQESYDTSYNPTTTDYVADDGDETTEEIR